MRTIITSIVLMSLSFVGMSQNPNGRISLVETFTSSTCGPCNPGNITLEGFLADPANDDETVSLKYQMSWPGSGDPYYTDEGNVRRNYYSVSGIPHTRIDAEFGDNPANLSQYDFNVQYAVDPLVALDAYYQVDEATQTVDVQVDVEALYPIAYGHRVFVVIFEYETSNNVKSNGETEFFHVMKKMIPGATGAVIFPMDSLQIDHYEYSYTFNGNYVLPPDANNPIDDAVEHSVEEFSDLGVAVWVQNINSQEVVQAAYAINGYNPAGVNGLEEHITSLNLYPNPASNKTTVAFDLSNQEEVDVNVYNLLGQVVYTESLSDLKVGRNYINVPTSDFNNGIYTVELLVGGKKKSRRLVVRN